MDSRWVRPVFSLFCFFTPTTLAVHLRSIRSRTAAKPLLIIHLDTRKYSRATISSHRGTLTVRTFCSLRVAVVEVYDFHYRALWRFGIVILIESYAALVILQAGFHPTQLQPPKQQAKWNPHSSFPIPRLTFASHLATNTCRKPPRYPRMILVCSLPTARLSSPTI